MGQRNATYVIVENNGRKSITPIYNQWNYVSIQAPKIKRGIEGVLGSNWQHCDASKAIPLVYYAFAGNAKQGSEFVGGRIEIDCYGHSKKHYYTGAFQEDNNNGWNILKFIVDEHKTTVQLYCVVGSEDEERANSESIDGYFYEGDKEVIDWVKGRCTWNPLLESEATAMLSELANNTLKAAN